MQIICTHDISDNIYLIRKILEIFSFVLSMSTKESHTLTLAVNTLHRIRPLANPCFTMKWFDLSSSPKLVVSLASAHYSWPLLQMLIADMCVTVVMSKKSTDDGQNQHPLVFQTLYRALLRFILILSHDFPDFMYSSSLTLVKFLPLEFTQARNIILSAAPKNMVIESPLNIDLKVDHLPDVHQICYPLQPALASLPEDAGRAIESLIESKDALVINESIVPMSERAAANVMKYEVLHESAPVFKAKVFLKEEGGGAPDRVRRIQKSGGSTRWQFW